MPAFFELVPPNTNLPFVGRRRLFIGLSIIAVLASFLAMGLSYVRTGQVLNFGIDFQGGSQVRLALTREVPIGEIREIIESSYEGSSVVAVPDAENEVLIRVKDVLSIGEAQIEGCRSALDKLDGAKLTSDGFDHPTESSKLFLKFDAQPKYTQLESLLAGAGCVGSAEPGQGKPEEFPVEFALAGIGVALGEKLDSALGDDTVGQVVASETVGAKVGERLKIDGAAAMLYALGFIFLYVMLRFDLRYAPGGIVALGHDAIITVGVFAVLGKEFNLQIVAALLTIVGYSINDTIVVFDRIRERVALAREVAIEETVNTAINETLSRTLLTSGTTLLVVISTWTLGSGPIKDFAFALLIGISVGTYSSVFVAAPVFLWINERFYRGKGHLLSLERDDADAAREAGAGRSVLPETPAADLGGEVSDALPTEGGEAGDTIDAITGEKKAGRRRRPPGPSGA